MTMNDAFKHTHTDRQRKHVEREMHGLIVNLKEYSTYVSTFDKKSIYFFVYVSTQAEKSSHCFHYY
jgi:hypothetical protein